MRVAKKEGGKEWNNERKFSFVALFVDGKDGKNSPPPVFRAFVLFRLQRGNFLFFLLEFLLEKRMDVPLLYLVELALLLCCIATVRRTKGRRTNDRRSEKAVASHISHHTSKYLSNIRTPKYLANPSHAEVPYLSHAEVPRKPFVGDTPLKLGPSYHRLEQYSDVCQNLP